MGKVVRNTRWTKAADYKGKARNQSWLFLFALVFLPVVAFGLVLTYPWGSNTPAEADIIPLAANLPSDEDREEAYFSICSGPVRVTCVVDGDTIWYRGEKIRLVGFDTPEVGEPECANEARLGALATQRLQQLLNSGPFSLVANPDGRAKDQYGRSLRVVSRGGQNLGDVLLAEGLAERRSRQWNTWC